MILKSLGVKNPFESDALFVYVDGRCVIWYCSSKKNVKTYYVFETKITDFQSEADLIQKATDVRLNCLKDGYENFLKLEPTVFSQDELKEMYLKDFTDYKNPPKPELDIFADNIPEDRLEEFASKIKPGMKVSLKECTNAYRPKSSLPFVTVQPLTICIVSDERMIPLDKYGKSNDINNFPFKIKLNVDNWPFGLITSYSNIKVIKD